MIFYPIRWLTFLLVAALLMWGWGNRTGRYQASAIGHEGFIILDTNTGVHWVYERAWSEQDNRYIYRFMDSDPGIPFRYRIVPPSGVP